MHTHQTNTADVAIRAVREADLPAYRALRLEALRSHPEAFGSDHDESAARPDAWWLDRIRQGDGTGQGLSLVAEVAGEGLVGMTGIRREPGAKVCHGAMIWGVYVKPAWRGRGVGRAMLDRCLDWGAAQGVAIAHLAVVTSNADAIRCYVAAGFQAFGVQPAVIRAHDRLHDMLLMFRRL